jgi:uncharacterized protein
MTRTKRIFLTAEWRDLVMLNYEVDAGLLSRFVPAGTVLDSFEGKTYVSLVGFQFRKTRLFGAVVIPFHTYFDEVNLRFYVRRKFGDEERRGVVFIAEIVPRRAVAQVARTVYGENYVCLPMKHSVSASGAGKTAEYAWRLGGGWCRIYAQAEGSGAPGQEGSLEQFITEHYWGYSPRGRGGSLEYQVEHVPWNVWRAGRAGFEGDASALYGKELAEIVRGRPDSAFIADGSAVTVFGGKILGD